MKIEKSPPVFEEVTDEAEETLVLDEVEGETTLADFSSDSMYPPPEKRGFAPSGSIGQGLDSLGLCSRARRSPFPMLALSSVSSLISAGSSRTTPPMARTSSGSRSPDKNFPSAPLKLSGTRAGSSFQNREFLGEDLKVRAAFALSNMYLLAAEKSKGRA